VRVPIGAEDTPTPRLALLVSGIVVAVPDDLAVDIIAAEPTVRREWLRWSRQYGPGGRLILIDADMVASILQRFPLSL
jgi:hypothetical protein